MVSRGRSSDRAKGGAHSWPSPIVPKLPSRDNSGDDGHVAFGTESGFPKFPHFKIFRWRLCIWQSSPCLALLSKSVFSKRFAGFGLFGSDLEPWPQNRVRAVARSPAGLLQFLATLLGILESLTRTRDILFWSHLCVSLHCMCIGAPRNTVFAICHSWTVCRRLVLSRHDHKADRLWALPVWEHKPRFYRGTLLTIRPSVYSESIVTIPN